MDFLTPCQGVSEGQRQWGFAMLAYSWNFSHLPVAHIWEPRLEDVGLRIERRSFHIQTVQHSRASHSCTRASALVWILYTKTLVHFCDWC